MTEPLKIRDPQTGKAWEITEKNKIKNIRANVYARWIINCVVPKQTIRKVVKAEFLEPILVKNKAILSLCCIFMKNAAPTWMPLHLGPGSHNCALRVACIDKRDGTQAVWVDHRHTNSFLAPALELLGFPAVHNDLEVVEQSEVLELKTFTGALDCQLQKESLPAQNSLFENEQEFGDFFCAGIRSYSENEHKKRLDIIDLHKLKDNKFIRKNMGGILKTIYGTWFTESVYVTHNGLYEWVYQGHVV